MTNKILYIAKNALIVEVLAVTALLLFSCTRTAEPEGIGGNSFVNFGVTVEGAANATRGTMLNSESSLSKISATAWNDDTEHDHFISGYQDFTLTEGSATTDIRWTRPYGKIFYAYANLPASGAGVTSDTYEGQTLTYTAVPADAANQNDILMGTYSGDGGSTRTASLVFKHALTSVVFKVGTLTNVKKITKISIKGVYASGSVTQAADGTFSDWTGTTSTQTVTQTITADLPTTAGTAIGVPFILIPQTAASGLAVEMELTLTDDSTMTCTGTLGSTTGGIIWEAGKTTTYAVNYDDRYKDLTFTTSVSDWGDAPDIPTEVKFPTAVDYVEIAGLKWATQNLAISEYGKKTWTGSATDSEVKVPGKDEYVIMGDFFQWAAYPGCRNSYNGDFGLLHYTEIRKKAWGDEDDYIESKEDLYKHHKGPYYDGYNYTKYKSPGSSLEVTDDVASLLLGGDWHIPTKEELESLVSSTYFALDESDKGIYVFLPEDVDKSAGSAGLIEGIDKSKAKLFFPSVGKITYYHPSEQDINSDYCTRGYYLSSTLHSTDECSCLDLYYYKTLITTINSSSRGNGYSIRPVSK